MPLNGLMALGGGSDRSLAGRNRPRILHARGQVYVYTAYPASLLAIEPYFAPDSSQAQNFHFFAAPNFANLGRPATWPIVQLRARSGNHCDGKFLFLASSETRAEKR